MVKISKGKEVEGQETPIYYNVFNVKLGAAVKKQEPIPASKPTPVTSVTKEAVITETIITEEVKADEGKDIYEDVF